jgi:hypothetical protein
VKRLPLPVSGCSLAARTSGRSLIPQGGTARILLSSNFYLLTSFFFLVTCHLSLVTALGRAQFITTVAGGSWVFRGDEHMEKLIEFRETLLFYRDPANGKRDNRRMNGNNGPGSSSFHYHFLPS